MAGLGIQSFAPSKGAIARGVRRAACVLALFVGTSAAAQSNDPPEPLSRENIGDWVFECYGKSEAEAKCQLYQRVLTQDATVVAMVTAMTWSPEKQALETHVTLPLGVDLLQPPVLLIDNAKPIPLAWTRCLSEGCYVEGDFGEPLLSGLKGASRVAYGVVSPDTGRLTIPLSLTGFPEALDRLIAASGKTDSPAD